MTVDFVFTLDSDDELAVQDDKLKETAQMPSKLSNKIARKGKGKLKAGNGAVNGKRKRRSDMDEEVSMDAEFIFDAFEGGNGFGLHSKGQSDTLAWVGPIFQSSCQIIKSDPT